MRTIVNDECISASNAQRIVVGLSLTTDSKRGAITARTLRFDRVSDVLDSIGKETGLSYNLVHSGAGMVFTFTVLQGTDVSSTVVLSTDYGNVKEIEYYENLLEYKNVVYAAGTGDAAARVVRSVYTGTEPSSWTRRETLYDASDCTTDAALDSKGLENLAELVETITLDVQYLQTSNPTYVLGTHFKLGDIITVDYVSAGIKKVARVTTIETNWIRTGKSIKFTVGKKKPDFVSLYKYHKKANSAQKRR